MNNITEDYQTTTEGNRRKYAILAIVSIIIVTICFCLCFMTVTEDYQFNAYFPAISRMFYEGNAYTIYDYPDYSFDGFPSFILIIPVIAFVLVFAISKYILRIDVRYTMCCSIIVLTLVVFAVGFVACHYYFHYKDNLLYIYEYISTSLSKSTETHSLEWIKLGWLIKQKCTLIQSVI